jgi:hypothetical protein
MQPIRNGDLLIVQVDSIPKGLTQKKDTILLEGEATNHFHRLSGGTVFSEIPTLENNWSLGFFDLETETELTHEEHKTIKLKPGKYHFYSQREYDPQMERRVLD